MYLQSVAGFLKFVIMFIRHFVVNHSMRLAMFNEFVSLKLLVVAEILSASTIIMLRRFKLIKGGLQTMVINDKWDATETIW